MSAVVFHRRRAERFARLLDEANGRRRHHAHAPADEDLPELVSIGHRLATLEPTVEIEPGFRTELRAMLVATAEREGIGAVPGGVGHVPQMRRPSAMRTALGTRHGRARGAIIIGVAVGAIAVSGMSAASDDAKPGDALYGVKRSTERAQLALASSDLTRGQLYLDFARIRRAEALTVGHDRAGAAALLADMDADTRQGVKLLTTSAIYRRDPAALNAIDAFVGEQQREIGSLLDQLTAADRQRALASLALLDAVHRRSQALRETLGCASPGSDQLGPLPATCAGKAPVRATKPAGQSPPGTSSPTQAHTERTGSTEAAETFSPTPMITGTEAVAPAEPTDQPTHGKKKGKDGLLSALGRILADLLG